MYYWPVVGHVSIEAEGTGNGVPCLLCNGRNVTMRPQSLAVAAIKKFRTTQRLSSQDKDLIHSLSLFVCSLSSSKARFSTQQVLPDSTMPLPPLQVVEAAASGLSSAFDEHTHKFFKRLVESKALIEISVK
jgi:hypothetical protein